MVVKNNFEPITYSNHSWEKGCETQLGTFLLNEELFTSLTQL